MRWLFNSQMLILPILNASLAFAGESPSMLPKDPTAQIQENSAKATKTKDGAATEAVVNQLTLEQAVNEGVKSNLDILLHVTAFPFPRPMKSLRVCGTIQPFCSIRSFNLCKAATGIRPMLVDLSSTTLFSPTRWISAASAVKLKKVRMRLSISRRLLLRMRFV